MFRFQDPFWFQLLLILPIIVLAALYFQARQRKKILQAFGKRLTPFLTANVSYTRRRWKLVIEVLTMALLVASLARPQMGQGKQEVKSQGVELMLALDVSTSMLAEDQKPNRLTLAKRELNRLLDRLTGDKVGLIAFAGSSVLVSPLTQDYSSVRMFLDSLTPESVSTQGTSFAHVIDTAVSAFKRGGLADEEASHVTRVLLLATDGEVQDNTALKMADAATKQGIRIFTLGFGTRAGAPIPLRDDRGNLQGYKKDKSGGVITTAANDEVLAQLARAGKGSYQHSTFTGDEIESIRADIDKLQKSAFDSSIAESYNEYFQFPLILSMLLLVSELLLGERKQKAGVWKGRFEIPVLILGPLGLVAAMGYPQAAHAQTSNSPRAIWENNHAVQDLKRDMEEEAKQQMQKADMKNSAGNKSGDGQRSSGGSTPAASGKFTTGERQANPLQTRDRLIQAVHADNENATIHFNLGLTLDLLKDEDNSLRELKTAARTAKDDRTKFSAYFNLGVLYGQSKKIGEAIQAYQEALRVMPDSKEAKANIELLFQKQAGGGGQGQQNPQSGKQGNNQDQKKNPDSNPQQNQPPKQQPHPFQGKDLSKQDVDRILDELKRQEEEIRGRVNDKQHHDAPPDKDW